MAMKSSVADFKNATKGFKKHAVAAKEKEAPEFGFAGVKETGVYPGQCLSADMGVLDDKPGQAYVKFSVHITEGACKGQRGDVTHFISRPPQEVDDWENGVKTGKKKKLSEKERDDRLQQSIDNVTFAFQKLGYDTTKFGNDPMGDDWPMVIADINETKPQVDLDIRLEDKRTGKKREYPQVFFVKVDQDRIGGGNTSEDTTAITDEELAANGDPDVSSDDDVVSIDDDPVVEDEVKVPEPGSSKWRFVGNAKIKTQQCKILTVNAKESTADVELLKDKKKAKVPFKMLEYIKS